jgi:hypothetical protein
MTLLRRGNGFSFIWGFLVTLSDPEAQKPWGHLAITMQQDGNSERKSTDLSCHIQCCDVTVVGFRAAPSFLGVENLSPASGV